jgi:hypothetical protein
MAFSLANGRQEINYEIPKFRLFLRPEQGRCDQSQREISKGLLLSNCNLVREKPSMVAPAASTEIDLRSLKL